MAPDTDDPLLLSVAGSIADGAPVDWPDVTQRIAEAPGDVLAQLRLVDEIARFHEGDLPLPGEATSGATTVRWGRFLLRGELGRGAGSVVYRAFDPDLEQEVALKVLRHDPAISEARLLAEGRMLVRVRHRHVVSVLGIERVGPQVGLWMELVSGRTLHETVLAGGRLSAREAAGIGVDVCRALAAIHQAGLLHGDVKAQNVMREEGGRVVLMDLGAGRELASASLQDAAGTPLYLAPEVFDGRPRTPASDVYSVGVLLYFLVTGAYPVEGDTRTGVARQHTRQPPVRLRERRSDLPGAFLACVDRATSVDAAQRFQTANELADALTTALTTAPAPPVVEAREVNASSATSRAMSAGAVSTRAASAGIEPARLRPMWTIGWVVGGLGLALVVTLAGFWPARRESAPAASLVANPGRTVGADGAPAPPPAGAYRVDAAVYRAATSGPAQRLAPGARVASGDRLYLDIRTSAPVHVYVVNEDDQGESYLLFPLPGQDAGNPLSGGTRHRLPGHVAGAETYWQVTSAGGREHFLIFASPERLTAFEMLLSALPRPVAGRRASGARLGPGAATRLRGVGGLAAAPSPEPQRPVLSGQFTTPLASTPETVNGVWVRQITFENPR